MRMKLIMSLLMLCIAFSIGSAMAQTDSMVSMEKPTAGSTDRMAGSPGQVVVVMAGNVTGKVTYSKLGNMDMMSGMAGKTGTAGNMGSTGKPMTRNINGHLLIVKDIEKNLESIVIIGKIDGMSGKAIIVGKIDHNREMAGIQNDGKTVMAGKIDNMDGVTDDQKVIVTGTINCNMIGDVMVTGKTGAMKGMAEMSGPGDMAQSQADNMAGSMGSMPGDMDNKNVIATGTVNCDVTGDLVVIGQLGAIKEMVGQKEKGLTGKMIATVESGKNAGMDGSKKAEFTGKMSATMAETGKNAEMDGSKKADFTRKMSTMAQSGKNAETDEKIGCMAGSDTCAYKSKNYEMNGMPGNMDVMKEKMGKIREKMGNFDVMMSGIVRCKMTGINLVVVGKADEMAGMMGEMNYGMDMAGEESKSCMTATGMSQAGVSGESQTCNQNKAAGMMAGMTEMSGMTTENNAEASTCTAGQPCKSKSQSSMMAGTTSNSYTSTTTGTEKDGASTCEAGKPCDKDKTPSGTSAQENQGKMPALQPEARLLNKNMSG